jgi:hypothetical protein
VIKQFKEMLFQKLKKKNMSDRILGWCLMGKKTPSPNLIGYVMAVDIPSRVHRNHDPT